MFDFGAINKSAEAMAQAATDIVSRLESIENLTREQNALLTVLVHVAINGAASLSDGEQLTASQLGRAYHGTATANAF